METTTQPQKPAQSLQPQASFSSDRPLRHISGRAHEVHEKDADYDPCENAPKFSPFYLYNHDTPRPSTDGKDGLPKPSIHVSIRDLELGDITPSVTQEKLSAQRKPRSKFRFWERREQCLTKPKNQRWLQRLPKKQRIMVRLAIALLIAGAMVGIAVGIAAALHSPVNGTDQVVGQHS